MHAVPFFLIIVILVDVIVCSWCNSCLSFAGKCCKMSFTTDGPLHSSE